MKSFLLLAILGLFASPADRKAPETARPDESALEYSIGPKDLLEIKVLEIPEMNGERRVSETGGINLPVLGDVQVSGLTASAARGKIESALKARYVRRATVSLVVKDFASKPVSVVGAVQRPGNLSISGRWTLLQAIAAAGGLTEKAGRKIYILRGGESGSSDPMEISTEELLRGSAATANVQILPSDVVQVPPRSAVRVFCLGEVKQPGSLEFDADDRISVLSALAKAGGLTERASYSIRIKRRDKDGRDSEQVVHYGRIVAGKEPDVLLQPDDVVVVKESFF
jgi:polysaccharide export outer membrane protein